MLREARRELPRALANCCTILWIKYTHRSDSLRITSVLDSDLVVLWRVAITTGSVRRSAAKRG